MKHNILYIICFVFGLSMANGQTLETFLQEAEKNSTAILAKQLEYESSVEKVNEVGSLPNTKLGVGVFAQAVETRVGPQRMRFSASQEIPWFGILKAQKANARSLANAQSSEITFLKRQLALDVKLAYYKMYLLQQKLEITKAHVEIVDTYEKLALNELENNRSTMVDVLKIKMKKNSLSQQLQTLTENIQTEKATFNLLLNKSVDAEVIIEDSVTIEPPLLMIEKEAINANPKLQQLDYLETALQQSEIVAKKEGNPSIGFGLDYVLVAERSGVVLPDNGKDVIMPMVTLSIPLFSKKHVSKQKQLRLQQEVIKQNKITVKNQLLMALENAINNIKNAQESIQTQKENITQAKQAKEVILAAYQTAKMDFEQLLEIDQLALEFELQKEQDLNTYLSNIAIVEFLLKN